MRPATAPADDATQELTAAPVLPPSGPADEAPPEQLGRYQVRGPLGRGGMGVVYRAFDPALAREVAIKVLSGSAGLATRARFLREARAVAALEHPRVVPVYDVGLDGDRAWFAMPVVRGETLAARLARGRLDPAEALGVATAIAEALAEAHRRGLVHRDVKPSNILLQESGEGPRPLLADFGLAAELDEAEGQVTLPGDVLGTPMYMPPEQAEGERAGPTADVYALGAVLYEMLAGASPYERAHPLAVLRAVASGPPPALDRRAPHVDPALRALVQRAMARDPADRYPDGEALLAALRALNTDTSGTPAAPVVEVPAHAGAAARGLPREHDRFVGRDAELALLERRFAEGARLITLQGPGGMGKTRLATRFAWTNLNRWPGGAWFCALAEARDRDGLAIAVARALDVPLGKGDAIEQLGDAIASRGVALLVLDNLEQVVEPARAAIARWLEAAPQAGFLVTSRALLGLPGEAVTPLEPLSADPAASLFVARAAAARPGYAPDPDEAARVGQLVALLEGMPLPIELAAARMRVLGLPQILARLGDRLRLLAGGRGPDRHATLRAAIDWSWELLDPAERAAFAQCSVFAGGFTMEAAEAVIDTSEISDASWPVDLVQSLVEKSLVRADARGAEPRLALFVDLATYGAEKLRTPGAFPGSGPEAERRAFERHADWYARLGVEDGPEAPRRAADWLATVLELDNALAGARRMLALRDPRRAEPLARAIARGLYLRGPYGLGVEILTALAAITPPERLPYVRALRGASLYLSGALHEAVAEHLAADAGLVGDSPTAVNNLTQLGTALRRVGRPAEAQERYEAALQMARRLGDLEGEARATSGFAGLAVEDGDLVTGEARAREALALHLQSGQSLGAPAVQTSLAVIASMRGQDAEAEGWYEVALEGYRAMAFRRGEAEVLYNFGMLRLDRGHLDAAAGLFTQAARIWAEVGYRAGSGNALGALGELQAMRGEAEAARATLSRALAEHRATGYRAGESDWLLQLAILDRRAGDLDAAEARVREAIALLPGAQRRRPAVVAEQARLLALRGRADEAREAVEEALPLAGDDRARGTLRVGLAWAALAAGDLPAAAAALSAAEADFGPIAQRAGSWAGRELAEVRAALDAAAPAGDDIPRSCRTDAP